MAKQFIYHEKQSAALCGVHCLNNLLQGPYTNAGSLAEIAHELDAQERELMLSQGTDTPEALRYVASESINVDESGNFSITVLQTAIQRSHNLILKRYQTNNNASSNTDPSSSHGFVVNLHQHWFSLRPIYGAWWNLNSMLSQPTRVGDVYLSAYLGTLRMEGYTIFEVVGRCPPPAQSGGEYGLRMPSWGAETSWHSISDLVSNANGGSTGASAANPFPGVGNRLVSGGGGGSGQDDDLARAIAASLDGNSNSNSGGDGMDAALAQALAMSRNDGKMGSMNENCDDMEDDDSALQRAIAMSMQGGSGGGNNNENNDAVERRKKMLEAAEKRNKR